MILSNGFEPDPRVLAEGRALVSAGMAVTILCWDREGVLPRRERREGILLRRLRIRSTDGRGRGQAPFTAAFLAGAVAAGLRERFDLLWSHDLDTLPAGLLLGRMRRVPVIFDAHESYPDMVAASVGPAVTGALRALERRLVPRASAVVTVGERLAAHLRSLGARRVVVAGNWKKPAEFSFTAGEREKLRAQAGIPAEAFLVSSIGWLGPERQLESLIRAVRAEEACWLLLAGRGPLADLCRREAANCRRIRFAGWVDADRVPGLTACSDAVFYGFDPENGNARFSAPNKLFEAVAAGVPVVTGPFGEIREIVAEYRCGVVLPDYAPESVREGLREVREGESFIEGCRRARERYHRARADRAIVDLATELLGGAVVRESSADLVEAPA